VPLPRLSAASTNAGPGSGIMIGMQRDSEQLNRVAELVATDLQRTLPGHWSCSVSSELVLSVRHGTQEEQVLLGRDVAEDNWPAEAWSDQHRGFTVAEDAAELVMGEVMEVLRAWGEIWPTCPAHGGSLSECSGVWVCDVPPNHDVEVGQLAAR
jgi:hypothetical protein